MTDLERKVLADSTNYKKLPYVSGEKSIKGEFYVDFRDNKEYILEGTDNGKYLIMYIRNLDYLCDGTDKYYE